MKCFRFFQLKTPCGFQAGQGEILLSIKSVNNSKILPVAEIGRKPFTLQYGIVAPARSKVNYWGEH
ncbi:MAG TPA: hypothetical protein DCL08_06820 [Anaerolineaceae bacterium]|nr:MAG: hypothetical protein XE06_1168 [Anaerolineaceae bacterium 46_22]HAF48935.1 hypothetical protein [Anaerolineaceae bacterium]